METYSEKMQRLLKERDEKTEQLESQETYFASVVKKRNLEPKGCLLWYKCPVCNSVLSQQITPNYRYYKCNTEGCPYEYAEYRHSTEI